MITNEQRRERYHNDKDYRNKILKRFKDKYNTDEEYRSRKIENVIKYNKEHLSNVKINRKQYYKDNCEYIKNRVRFNNHNNRYEVLYWYSDGLMKCNECGEDHMEFLCIEHINDTGADHRREIGLGGGRIYNYLLKDNFPEGYQVLCNNCNFLKEYITVQNKPKSQTKYAIARRKQQYNTR